MSCDKRQDSGQLNLVKPDLDYLNLLLLAYQLLKKRGHLFIQ